MGLRVAPSWNGLAFGSPARNVAKLIEPAATPLAIFGGTRLGLLILGFFSYILVPHGSIQNGPSVLTGSPLVDGWLSGEAASYVVVSIVGYWTDPLAQHTSTAVLPLFPLLTSALNAVGVTPAISALLVSNGCFGLALILLYPLVARRLSIATAQQACLFMAVLPFSFLYGAAYPISLVLLLAIVAMLAEDAGRPVAAGLLAALAALTHPFGLAVWIALAAVWAWNAARPVVPPKHVFDVIQPTRLFSLAFAPLALGAFAAYLRREIQLPYSGILTTMLGLRDPSPASFAVWAKSATSSQLLIALNLSLVLIVVITLPRTNRVFGRFGAAFCVALVVLATFNPLNLGPATGLAFPSVAVLSDFLIGELTGDLALGASSLVLAVLTAAFLAQYPVVPALKQPHPLTPVEFTSAYFHQRFSLEHPSKPAPTDLNLMLDNSLLILADYSPVERAVPGGTVETRYYINVQNETGQGYLLSARLRDAQGKQWAQADKVLWGQADAEAFGGAKVARLDPNNTVIENVDLSIPQDLPLGAYSLDTYVFRIPSFQRISLESQDGKRTTTLTTASLEIGRTDELGNATSLAPPRALHERVGTSLELYGYDLTVSGSTASVSLYWEALSTPDYDYTVFVQALDPAGKVVAQSDSFPAAGRFPTSRLRPGDALRDVHVLAIPPGKGPVQFIAGMYRLDTMQRLAFQGQVGPATDHVTLGTLGVGGG